MKISQKYICNVVEINAECPASDLVIILLTKDDNKAKELYLYPKKYTLLVRGYLMNNNCYDCLMMFKLTRIRKNNPNQGMSGL